MGRYRMSETNLNLPSSKNNIKIEIMPKMDRRINKFPYSIEQCIFHTFVYSSVYV